MEIKLKIIWKHKNTKTQKKKLFYIMLMIFNFKKVFEKKRNKSSNVILKHD